MNMQQELSKKAQTLKQLVQSDSIELIMEAHNGLSARIAEDVGFKAIWASGLAIATSLGVRDNNEASWSQCIDVLEWMSDATQLPILFDGDTGFGNFNNFRRLVRKLEQRSIAGVVIEDKIFPKLNSFVGNNHNLAPIDEFCGKIKAGVEQRNCEDFQIIARTEAFISGAGLTEALKRAEAYRQAGADAVFVHSKKDNADEIFAFAKEWNNRLPIVIAPTTYYKTSTSELNDAGISIYICANHFVRSSVEAMKKVGEEIIKSNGISTIEDNVASLQEIWNLLDYKELSVAEKKYLP